MNRVSSRIFGALLLVGSLGVFTATLIGAVWYQPQESVAVPLLTVTPQPETPTYHALPYRISIPSIGVNAGVQQVGIKPNGQMANPTNFTDVGWYTGSSIPGNGGAAVIAGHLDNGLGRRGVFKDLELLSMGDLIQVIDAEGAKHLFTVSDIRRYAKDDDASPVFTKSGMPVLNLITCVGEWIPEEKMYAERLVVTAVPEGEEMATTTPEVSL